MIQQNRTKAEHGFGQQMSLGDVLRMFFLFFNVMLWDYKMCSSLFQLFIIKLSLFGVCVCLSLSL